MDDRRIARNAPSRYFAQPLDVSRFRQADESQQMRPAAMSILDALVNAGSSVAFRLREDFVTP